MEAAIGALHETTEKFISDAASVAAAAKTTGCSKKTVPLFYFYDNFRKWTPILTIFSPLEPEIYDA